MLISSPGISKIAMAQLLESIYSVADSEERFPPSDFISGLNTNGLYAYRYSKGANIWTRTRHAARRTNLSIDVSDQKNISILIDDICTAHAKAVNHRIKKPMV